MTTNSNDSGNQEDREASGEDVDSDTAEAVTDGGQPIALEERLDTGSKSWEDVEKDKGYLHHRPSFPPCTSARTTLHSRDADDDRRERYEVFFLASILPSAEPTATARDGMARRCVQRASGNTTEQASSSHEQVSTVPSRSGQSRW